MVVCAPPPALQHLHKRCQFDIMYAKLSCDLCFAEANLGNIPAHPFTTYFVRILNGTQMVTGLTGFELQLHTFHGLDDWSTSVITQSAKTNDI